MLQVRIATRFQRDDEKRLSSNNQDGIAIGCRLPVISQQVYLFDAALCYQ